MAAPRRRTAKPLPEQRDADADADQFEVEDVRAVDDVHQEEVAARDQRDDPDDPGEGCHLVRASAEVVTDPRHEAEQADRQQETPDDVREVEKE